jgi:hypothetical protein
MRAKRPTYAALVRRGTRSVVAGVDGGAATEQRHSRRAAAIIPEWSDTRIDSTTTRGLSEVGRMVSAKVKPFVANFSGGERGGCVAGQDAGPQRCESCRADAASEHQCIAARKALEVVIAKTSRTARRREKIIRSQRGEYDHRDTSRAHGDARPTDGSRIATGSRWVNRSRWTELM